MNTSSQVARRTFKNAGFQLISMLALLVPKFAMGVLIAHWLGLAAVGEYGLVMTLSLMCTALATFGVTAMLVREVAVYRGDVNRYISNSLGFVSLTSLLTIPVMYSVSLLLGQPPDMQTATLLAGVALIFESLANTLAGAFNGFERMELRAATFVVQELAFLGLGLGVFWLGFGLLALFVVYIPSRVVGVVVALALYRLALGQWLTPRFEWPIYKQLAGLSYPYALNMAMGPAYVRLDMLLLPLYVSTAFLGLYEVASGNFYRLSNFARMFNDALLPTLAREFEFNPAQGRAYLSVLIKCQVAGAMLLTVWLFGLADWLTALIYPPQFGPSALIFRLFVLAVSFQFLNNVLVTTLTATGLQPQRTKIVAIAALFNIAINLFYLMPRYGIVGAALASVTTELVYFGGAYLALAGKVTHPLAGVRWGRLIGAGAILVGLFGLLASLLPLPAALGLSGLGYLGALAGLGVFSKAELGFIWRALRLKRLTPAFIQQILLMLSKFIN
jgi:O-antigen/teichoic acid export membrane protein